MSFSAKLGKNDELNPIQVLEHRRHGENSFLPSSPHWKLLDYLSPQPVERYQPNSNLIPSSQDSTPIERAQKAKELEDLRKKCVAFIQKCNGVWGGLQALENNDGAVIKDMKVREKRDKVIKDMKFYFMSPIFRAKIRNEFIQCGMEIDLCKIWESISAYDRCGIPRSVCSSGMTGMTTTRQGAADGPCEKPRANNTGSSTKNRASTNPFRPFPIGTPHSWYYGQYTEEERRLFFAECLQQLEDNGVGIVPKMNKNNSVVGSDELYDEPLRDPTSIPDLNENEISDAVLFRGEIVHVDFSDDYIFTNQHLITSWMKLNKEREEILMKGDTSSLYDTIPSHLRDLPITPPELVEYRVIRGFLECVDIEQHFPGLERLYFRHIIDNKDWRNNLVLGVGNNGNRSNVNRGNRKTHNDDPRSDLQGQVVGPPIKKAKKSRDIVDIVRAIAERNVNGDNLQDDPFERDDAMIGNDQDDAMIGNDEDIGYDNEQPFKDDRIDLRIGSEVEFTFTANQVWYPCVYKLVPPNTEKNREEIYDILEDACALNKVLLQKKPTAEGQQHLGPELAEEIEVCELGDTPWPDSLCDKPPLVADIHAFLNQEEEQRTGCPQEPYVGEESLRQEFFVESLRFRKEEELQFEAEQQGQQNSNRQLTVSPAKWGTNFGYSSLNPSPHQRKLPVLSPFQRGSGDKQHSTSKNPGPLENVGPKERNVTRGNPDVRGEENFRSEEYYDSKREEPDPQLERLIRLQGCLQDGFEREKQNLYGSENFIARANVLERLERQGALVERQVIFEKEKPCTPETSCAERDSGPEWNTPRDGDRAEWDTPRAGCTVAGDSGAERDTPRETKLTINQENKTPRVVNSSPTRNHLTTVNTETVSNVITLNNGRTTVGKISTVNGNLDVSNNNETRCGHAQPRGGDLGSDLKCLSDYLASNANGITNAKLVLPSRMTLTPEQLSTISSAIKLIREISQGGDTESILVTMKTMGSSVVNSNIGSKPNIASNIVNNNCGQASGNSMKINLNFGASGSMDRRDSSRSMNSARGKKIDVSNGNVSSGNGNVSEGNQMNLIKSNAEMTTPRDNLITPRDNGIQMKVTNGNQGKKRNSNPGLKVKKGPHKGGSLAALVQNVAMTTSAMSPMVTMGTGGIPTNGPIARNVISFSSHMMPGPSPEGSVPGTFPGSNLQPTIPSPRDATFYSGFSKGSAGGFPNNSAGGFVPVRVTKSWDNSNSGYSSLANSSYNSSAEEEHSNHNMPKTIVVSNFNPKPDKPLVGTIDFRLPHEKKPENLKVSGTAAELMGRTVRGKRNAQKLVRSEEERM